MTLTYGNLRDWDGAQLTSASDTLRADHAALERARDTLETEAVPSDWDGQSQDAATQRQTFLVNQINGTLDSLQDFERVVYAQAAIVTRISQDVAAIDTSASEQQFSIDSAGSVTDVAPPQEFSTPRQADAYTEDRVRRRDALVDRIEQVIDDALAVDSALVDARPAQVYNTGEGNTLVDPQVEAQWAEMTPEEQEAAAIAMAEDIAQDLGIEDFEVVIEDLEDKDGDGVDDDPGTNSYGSWNNGDRVLRLDVNDLDDPAVVIDTIAHELRHADQHQAVDDLNAPWFGQDENIALPPGATLQDVRRWDENFDDYKSTSNGDTFDEYYDQPVEVDARWYGEGYLDDYDIDDLDEHAGE